MRNWTRSQVESFSQAVAYEMIKLESDIAELASLAASPEGWRETVELSFVDQQIDRVFYGEEQPPLDVEYTLQNLQRFARYKIHARRVSA